MQSLQIQKEPYQPDTAGASIEAACLREEIKLNKVSLNVYTVLTTERGWEEKKARDHEVQLGTPVLLSVQARNQLSPLLNSPFSLVSTRDKYTQINTQPKAWHLNF